MYFFRVKGSLNLNNDFIWIHHLYFCMTWPVDRDVLINFDPLTNMQCDSLADIMLFVVFRYKLKNIVWWSFYKKESNFLKEENINDTFWLFM